MAHGARNGTTVTRGMERSFASDVHKLTLGAGEVFHGEVILALTKALLQAGVAYVGGYPGAPISHLMDVLADARRSVLEPLGVQFESSASEAGAAALLGASIHYPLRGAVTWKSIVGTNVASDALSNLASAGVTGGCLAIIGEDYGEGASVIQERTHAIALKSSLPLLDPRYHMPGLVSLTEQAFDLSEACHLPVLMSLRIRAAHMTGSFVCRDNRPPPFGARNPLPGALRDYGRIVLPPSTYAQERAKVAERLPAARRFIADAGLNEHFAGAGGRAGIIMQGGTYGVVLRGLRLLGAADAFGRSDLPLLVLNAIYPLVPEEIEAFLAGKDQVLIVEEGSPALLEQAVRALVQRAGLSCQVWGKGMLPEAGEYTADVVRSGLSAWLAAASLHPVPALARPGRAEARAAGAPPPAAPEAPVTEKPGTGGPARIELPLTSPAFPEAAGVDKPGAGTLPAGRPARAAGAHLTMVPEAAGAGKPGADGPAHAAVARPPVSLEAAGAGKPGAREPARIELPVMPPRPPGFCTGCPERPLFTALKLIERRRGPLHISMDIGCNTFATLPPFNLGSTVLGYGMSLASNGAVAPALGTPGIVVMGDGGFWHNGLVTGALNAHWNGHDAVLIIIENGYASATGQQHLPSTGSNPWGQPRYVSIEATLRGMGIDWIRRVAAYDVAGTMAVLEAALDESSGGLRVIISDEECMLARQRRERPLRAAAVEAGRPVATTRYGVDEEVCTGDRACMRLSGCPSLTLRPATDPLKDGPTTTVDQNCLACGLCASVAHAARLCPSFYSARRVMNPSRRQRLAAWINGRLLKAVGAS